VVDLDSMGVGMLGRVKSDPVIKNIIFLAETSSNT